VKKRGQAIAWNPRTRRRKRSRHRAGWKQNEFASKPKAEAKRKERGWGENLESPEHESGVSRNESVKKKARSASQCEGGSVRRSPGGGGSGAGVKIKKRAQFPAKTKGEREKRNEPGRRAQGGNSGVEEA